MNRNEKRKGHKAWANPVHLLMGYNEAVEKVRQWYAHAEKEPDDYDLTIRLFCAQRNPPTDAQVEDLINRADRGDLEADRMLSILALSLFTKKDPSPLEVWMGSVFDKLARRRGRGKPAGKVLWRNVVIANFVDRLLVEYPGMLAHRNVDDRDKDPPMSGCAIVAKALGLSTGKNIKEGSVDKIYKEQRPAK